ncbi:MAG: hypothetical protein K1X94_16680 [Sandaracinaceae bacterium]|nr:hypothetical protein [Sandaracinaceae bacterium]
MKRVPVPSILPVGAGFTFGQSPFRVKGVLYLGTQSFFTENVGGGLEALATEIEDPALRAFITQKFLPASLYDVMPVPALIAYEARTLRMSLDDYLLHRTRHQARKDLGGVYAWLLRLATPRLVAARLPRIMLQMFDFAQAEIVSETDDEVVTRLSGIPAPLAPWLTVGTTVYAETALKLAGASPRVDEPAVRPRGERAGLPLVDLEIPVRWSP